MLHVYRRATSESARELVWALRDEDVDASRLKRLPHPILRRNPVAGDAIICWGETVTPPAGVRVLNGVPLRSKFEDAQVLRAAGVPTIEVSRTRPPVANAVIDTTAQREAVRRAYAVFTTEMNDFLTNYRPGRTPPVAPIEPIGAFITAANRPAQPAQTWLGRMNNHIGGADLLTPPARPDYFVKKEAFTREFRVHSFKGLSIRAGLKVMREDFGRTPSNWIRSWDAGWRIAYGITPNPVTAAHRELAHRAVQALGLDFGAVDVAEKADGTLLVLEVNRAPGIEAGTPPKYAKAIQSWLAEPVNRN